MFHCNVILIMIIIILIKRTTHQANLNYTKDVSEQFGSFIISKIQVLNTVLVNVKALRCLHLLRSSVLLFRHPLSPDLFRISNFSVRHKSHLARPPPQIIKRIPEIVQKRLSTISSTEEIFEESKHFYEECLQRSGYTNVELKFTPTPEGTSRNKRNRSCNILWFNPPWSESVSTNIGKKFFSLIKKHFPRGHRYRSFINRNSVKLSYSCMENMRSIITKHNVSLLKKSNTPPPSTLQSCNCRTSTECPLEGKCLTKSIVYEATVKTSEDTYTYIGLTGDTFKARYSTHKSSFKHEKYRTATTLSQKIWELKESNVDYTLTWSILKKAHTYKG